MKTAYLNSLTCQGLKRLCIRRILLVGVLNECEYLRVLTMSEETEDGYTAFDYDEYSSGADVFPIPVSCCEPVWENVSDMYLG